MTDTFDAVLAEMLETADVRDLRDGAVHTELVREWRDRLAAAHAAEVAEIARLSEKRRLALIAMTEDRTLQRTRAEAAEARVQELEVKFERISNYGGDLLRCLRSQGVSSEELEDAIDNFDAEMGRVLAQKDS